jgi:hypothetical protein
MAKRSTTTAVVALMILAFTVAGCSVPDALKGCQREDLPLVKLLDKEPVLAQHPDGATLVESEADCENDTGYAYALREFKSDLDPDKVIAFYEQAAQRLGWTQSAETRSLESNIPANSPPATCFSKQIDGVDVALSVIFPGDYHSPSGPSVPLHLSNQYRVQLDGTHQKGNGHC